MRKTRGRRVGRGRRRARASRSAGAVALLGPSDAGSVQPPRGATRSRPTRRSTTPTCTRSSARTARATSRSSRTSSRSRSRTADRTSTRSRRTPATTSTSTTTATPSRTPMFRWTFQNIDKRGGNTFLYNNGPVTSIDDENLLFRQTYTLEASFNGGAVPDPGRATPRSRRRGSDRHRCRTTQKLRDQAVTTLPGGWKIFAGQADDPFFLDLRVFDLLYGGNLSEVGQDTLGRLQREHDRAAGAVHGRGAERRREAQPGHRRLAHHRAAAGADHRPTATSVRRLGAGLPARATRWSTRSSSRPA